jgi:hypothetical protein
MSTKSFLAELFDANFNRFILTSTVKVIYVLCLIVTTGVTSVFVLAGLGVAAVTDEPAIRLLTPILVLTAGGAIFLLGALFSRLVCEGWIVVYRIAENTTRLVEQGEARPAVAAGTADLAQGREEHVARAVA